jgi:hypothetical protein
VVSLPQNIATQRFARKIIFDRNFSGKTLYQWAFEGFVKESRKVQKPIMARILTESQFTRISDSE